MVSRCRTSEPDDSDLRRHAFGTTIDAATYDAVRPGYPLKAVSWLLGEPDAPLHVLDLGAGTGKLARVLVESGHHVIAVDPAEKMLAALLASMPSVETRVGSAEEIPLATGAVDAVLIGQAWHWMNPTSAGAEILRVLRPHGRVGLLWNFHDTREAWVAELDLLTRPGNEPDPAPDRPAPPDVPEFFGTAEWKIIDNPHTLSSPDLVTLVSTFSWVATHSERDRLITTVTTLADRIQGPDQNVTVPQLCHCYRYQIG